MISIIIPTLQEEAVLRGTLAALRSVRSVPLEIIVSDGGSTDATVGIAREFADRVIIHQEAQRQTIAHGRNAGARISCGEFLVFLDADCMLENPDGFLMRAVAHFAGDSKLVALTGRLRVLPEMETFPDRIVFGLTSAITTFRNNVLQKGDAPGGEFQMVRRTTFEEVGGYRDELVTCEDRDLFARLRKLGRVRSDPELTVFHTGRRAHNVGWLRLISLFIVNTISFRLRGKAVSKEWTLER